MDYFSKFLKGSSQSSPKFPPIDHAQEFHKSWVYVKSTLAQPDERQLLQGIKSTNVPAQLQSMVDALVWESTQTEEGGTGACLEYLLKNDVLGTLVRLSELDRPSGIQAEVLRTVQNMVVLLDEQFLVHSAVHRAVLRLLRTCVGDDIQEQLDGRRVMGAAGNAIRSQPSEYEEDLVNLLCILCSRIKTYRELLMIFFHDKHWYRSEPLFVVEEEDEDEDDEDKRAPSPSPSQETITSVQASAAHRKTEYEFLLFNYLLRFVHREGKIGEFARAGLLFLMDVAMSPSDSAIQPEGKDTLSEESVPSDPIVDAAIALAEYILDGDFSEVLGAGLSAVYSLLPSKLEFLSRLEDAGTNDAMVIGINGPVTPETKEQLEVEKEQRRAMGIEDANSQDFKQRLDHFLKLLEFLQDVLKRNFKETGINPSSLVGTAIVQSILDAVRRIFLENVLYPSILECSDLDGSAVAVMSYIEVTLRTLQSGPLADLFVTFLVNEDNDDTRPIQRHHTLLTLNRDVGPPLSRGTDAATKQKRRKSSAMALLEMEAPDTRRATQYFTTSRYTLKDLFMSNLQSKSQATATTALQLLQTLSIWYPEVTSERILIVIPDPAATSFPLPYVYSTSSDHPDKLLEDQEALLYPGTDGRDSQGYENLVFAQPLTSYYTHEREMGLYMKLISKVDPSHSGDVFSTGYDYYLYDALLAIQSQPAFQIVGDNESDLETRRKRKHRLNVNDPILSRVLESLRSFFSNTPDYNITLTGFLAKLALHPDRSLAGWLTFAFDNENPERARTLDSIYDKDGDDRSIDYRIEDNLVYETNILPAASMDENSRPVIHTICQGLVNQLDRYRQLVRDFDKFLIERRQGLLFSENLSDALDVTLDIAEEVSVVNPAPVRVPIKQKSKPKVTSSFAAFLTPRKSKPSPAATPEASRTTRKGDGTISASPFGSHYQQTGSIKVEPFVSPAPTSGSWAPVKSRKWNAEEEDVFGSSWSEARGDNQGSDWQDQKRDAGEEQLDEGKTITLSHLLDNVVILEESIKELVAIIHARRSLGIDSIRYL